MTVVCKLNICPYCESGFCRKKVIKINEIGLCSTLYNNRGEMKGKRFKAVDEQFKEKLIIEDAEVSVNASSEQGLPLTKNK